MKLSVLQYHKLHSELRDDQTITAADFKRQLTILKTNGYNPISCKNLYDYLMKIGGLPEKPVLITFDKGYACQYRDAAPILEDQGFSAVFFITAEFVLQSCCSEGNKTESFMNIEHLKQLGEFGFEIGIHGYINLNFTNSKLQELSSNIVRSFLLFNRLELFSTNVLAYPYGEITRVFWKTRRLYKMLKQEKIMLAFSKGNRVNDLSDTHRFNIHRIEISGQDTEKNFYYESGGIMELIQLLITIFKWLLILTAISMGFLVWAIFSSRGRKKP